MLKVLKLHYVNLMKSHNRQYFEKLTVAFVAIFLINALISALTYIFQNKNCTYCLFDEIQLPCKYDTFLSIIYLLTIIAIFYTAKTIIRSSYIHYDSEDDPLSKHTILFSILPTGKKTVLFGKLMYMLPLMLIACIISLLPYLPFFVWPVRTGLEFLKLHFTLTSSILLWELGRDLVLPNNKITTYLSFYLALAIYSLRSELRLGEGNLYWLLIPIVLVFIVAISYLLRYVRARDTELVEKELTVTTKKKGAGINSLLETNFITEMPKLAILFSLGLFINNNFLYIFAFLLPYLLALNTIKENLSGNPYEAKSSFNDPLALVKSLPIDKKKLISKLIISLIASLVFSIVITLTIAFLANYMGTTEHNLRLMAFSSLTILLPSVATALFLLLPKAIFRDYEIVNIAGGDMYIPRILLIGGTSITNAISLSTSKYVAFWGVLSVILCGMAIFVIKEAYEYMVARLTGPLDIHDHTKG